MGHRTVVGVVVLGSALSCIRGRRAWRRSRRQDAASAERGIRRQNLRQLEGPVRARAHHFSGFVGSEAFWGGKLQLHRALLGQKLGGVGAGLTPNQALKAGLKADVARVPKLLVEVMREGSVTFESPRRRSRCCTPTRCVG